jgi:hypothetical protein
MCQTPPEVVIATLSFIAVWLAAVLVILAVGRCHPAIRSFRQRMLAQWKPALFF